MTNKVSFNQDFSDRLRLLMDKNNIGVVELSRNIGITRQAISNYLDYKSMPNINIFKDIADFFNVSADYLLGKDLQPNKADEDLYNDIGLTSDTLEKLRELKKEALYSREDYAYLLYIINVLIQVEDFEEENGILCGLGFYLSHNNNDSYILSKNDIDKLSNPLFSIQSKKVKSEDLDSLQLFKLQNTFKDFKKRYLSSYAQHEDKEIYMYVNEPNEDGFYYDDDKELYYKNGEYFYTDGEYYYPSKKD